jgi:hypothetical protein
MIRSYLNERFLLVGKRLNRRTVTCGVPQGSVLGPALWNIFYDSLLNLEMPPGVQLVAFADDVAVIGISRNGELVGALINPALATVARWMRENVKIMRYYMHNRSLQTTQQDEREGYRLPVTCGVPQGSVLGPTLWNLFYDGVLRLPLPSGVKTLAFADDLAVLVTAHNANLAERLMNEALARVDDWMTVNGLEISPEKSECVVLTGKHSFVLPHPVFKGVRFRC